METNDYQMLTEWLTRNAHILAKRTPEETADIAIAVGFSRVAVAQWLTSQRFKSFNG